MPTANMKICDFGIAVDRRKSKTFFEKEKIVGTPLYMAPEQALGKKSDHRVDIYALGATLYTAVSGSHPFQGKLCGNPPEKVKEHPIPWPRRLRTRRPPWYPWWKR